MTNNNSDFKQTLWKTADSLRAQMDAAEYKHIVQHEDQQTLSQKGLKLGR